jgi:hypothetical protein
MVFYQWFFGAIQSALFSLVVVNDPSAWRLKLDIGLFAILYSVSICQTLYFLSIPNKKLYQMWKLYLWHLLKKKLYLWLPYTSFNMCRQLLQLCSVISYAHGVSGRLELSIVLCSSPWGLSLLLY